MKMEDKRRGRTNQISPCWVKVMFHTDINKTSRPLIELERETNHVQVHKEGGKESFFYFSCDIRLILISILVFVFFCFFYYYLFFLPPPPKKEKKDLYTGLNRDLASNT